MSKLQRLTALVSAVVFLVTAGWTPAAAAERPWNQQMVGGPVPDLGRKPVTIAIVDTGIDASHPTFGGRVLPAIDLVGGDGGDPNGHGTHVAGIAAGGSSGPAIGVFPAASLLPVRVLGADGTGALEAVIEGIRRAADRRADVINLSLGGDDVLLRNLFGSGLAEAITYAWNKGSIVVLATGNEGFLGGLLGSGYQSLPAVVVTSVGPDGALADYATSVGSAGWGIAAPGGSGGGDSRNDVLSALPGGQYGYAAGTSMAAPHVAGAAAALLAGGLSPTEAIDALLRTARRQGSTRTYGAGIVDARAAVATVTPPPPADPSPPAAPAPPAAPDPAPAGEPSATPPGSGAPTPRSSSTTGVPAPTVAAPAMVVPEEHDAPVVAVPTGLAADGDLGAEEVPRQQIEVGPAGGFVRADGVGLRVEDGWRAPPPVLVVAATTLLGAMWVATIATTVRHRPR